MLGGSLVKKIQSHPGPRMLWVLSCLAPADYETRLTECRAIRTRYASTT
jgi:hypothetical protein